MTNRNYSATHNTHLTTTHTHASLSPSSIREMDCRLTNFCTKEITARSRRKRRRCELSTTFSAPACTSTSENVSATFLPTTVVSPDAARMHTNTEAATTTSSPASRNCFLSNISNKVGSFRSRSLFTLHTKCIGTYIAAATALLLCSTTYALGSPCDNDSWWDPVKDKCIPCTACQGDMIPLRPCQLHRDTICGSIYDLKIDWVVLAKTEPNWKERRKSDEIVDFNMEHLTQEQLQQLHDEAVPLDWQTAALFMAVLACLLFFIVAACILIHHMRQWRRMERRLDQDVEELSTKLMAKLAEVQSLEGGTFFIGNADALRVPTTFHPSVLLPEKSGKHERRVLKTLQPGNVYIEENGSKG